MFNWLKKVLPVPKKASHVTSVDVACDVSLTYNDLPNECAVHKKRGNELLAQGLLEDDLAGSGTSQSETPEQSALRLIDEGNAIEDEGRIDEAMSRYENAIRLAPNLARAHLNRGNILLATDKAEEALEAYATALSLNPEYAAAHYNLGNANARLGRHEAAREAYREAIRLKPDFVDAEVALGCVQEDLGRFEDAAASYHRALGIRPDYAEVHSNLGNVLRNLGQLDDAAASYRRALELMPDRAEIHFELGGVLREIGQHDSALASFRRALEINPNHAEALTVLGGVLLDLGQVEAAIVSFRRALEIDPNFVMALINLGNALKEHGQLDAAVVNYRRALQIAPDFVMALISLGNALIDLGQLDDGVANYCRALEIDPNSVMALNNLGNALKELGQLDAAVANYRRALEIAPDFVIALYNLGNALKELGQFDAAVTNYRRALEIKPDYADAHVNLGIALYEICRLDAAEASLRRALEIDPDSALAHSNLGVILKDLGQLDGAVASCRRALEINPAFVEAQDILLFTHNCLVDQSAAVMLADAKRFGELVARRARPYTTWCNTPEPGRCLRVGLVSGDLFGHPVGFFVESVLAALKVQASDRLKLFAYPSHSRFDAVSERIKACCEGWHSAVRLSDESLAHRISEDGIDILIDLSGHTGRNRLPMFAWKPAPVQVSWLGYFATTGVAAMDYLIADPWTLPEAEEANFTEKIWRLPETRLCFTPPEVNVDVAPLPALTNGYITFGCFNNLTKMNDAVVALWARVLKAVPGSRLLLKAKLFEDVLVRQSVVERFGVHGMGADRLMMEGFDTRAKYLAAYHKVDIALDPFPYTGGTTSVEGLWMGVPVLTLAGERFLSRQGVGLLMNSGLQEWIAADADDYVARAVSHAADLQALAVLRKGLRQQVLASPIFDAPRFARHFEAALRGMWQKWCEQRQGGVS